MSQSVYQPGAAAGKDTYFDDSNTTTNRGPDNILGIGALVAKATTVYRSIIQIDLNSPTSGDTPTGAITITACQWDFNSSGATGVNTANAYRQDQCRRPDWVEDEATWLIFKALNNWGTAGASNTTTDVDEGVGHTFTLTNGGATSPAALQILTTAGFVTLVQDAWDNHAGIFIPRFKAVDEGATNLWAPDSSDHATAGNRPKLTIDWDAVVASERRRLPQFV